MNELTLDPSRTLRSDFTKQTLRRSIAARKRVERQRYTRRLITMDMKFMKQPVGALVALAVVILGSIGAYAAMNWFNGDVRVTSNNSVMAVDLSQCTASQLPPGVEQTDDRKNVQFKILGTPHIDAATLQRKLLTKCESDSVSKFYAAHYPGQSIGTQPSIVKAITPYTITLEVLWANQYTDKTFSIAQDTSFYALGQPSSLKDLKVGDTVIYAYDHPTGIFDESKNPLNDVDGVRSVFKTQYDTKEAYGKNGLNYDDANIMPMDHYRQLHK
jgi:hypothetical protein